MVIVVQVTIRTNEELVYFTRRYISKSLNRAIDAFIAYFDFDARRIGRILKNMPSVNKDYTTSIRFRHCTLYFIDQVCAVTRFSRSEVITRILKMFYDYDAELLRDDLIFRRKLEF